MLVLKNIIKNYDSHQVLNIQDFVFGPGLHWIKGGNGVGKSTLFRVLSGQTPFLGEVSLHGFSLKEDSIEFKSKISYAEAEPQFPSFLKGQALISFYEQVRKVPSSVASRLCERFELTGHLNQQLGTYSSGMLKKISLVCCLLADVELYILDEPLITLDTETIGNLCALISEMTEEGKTFLISSHQELQFTELKIDQIYLIKDKTLQCMS